MSFDPSKQLKGWNKHTVPLSKEDLIQIFFNDKIGSSEFSWSEYSGTKLTLNKCISALRAKAFSGNKKGEVVNESAYNLMNECYQAQAALEKLYDGYVFSNKQFHALDSANTNLTYGIAAKQAKINRLEKEILETKKTFEEFKKVIGES